MMKPEDIQKQLSDANQRLYEADAILKFIDHAEGGEMGVDVLATATAGARRILGEAAVMLDQLERGIEKEAQR